MKYRFHTDYNIATDGFSLAIITEDPFNNTRGFFSPFQIKTVDRANPILKEEAYCLTDNSQSVKDFLQAAMDAAYRFGLRPTGEPDHADELKAVRYHLEDMRTLVFKKEAA